MNLSRVSPVSLNEELLSTQTYCSEEPEKPITETPHDPFGWITVVGYAKRFTCSINIIKDFTSIEKLLPFFFSLEQNSNSAYIIALKKESYAYMGSYYRVIPILIISNNYTFPPIKQQTQRQLQIQKK